MKYTLETEIEAPRDQVVALFLDPSNLKSWQPELLSFEPMGDGAARAVGAKTRQVHKMGKREIEMIETITRHDMPSDFAATYETDGVWNQVENTFSETGEGRTHWRLTSDFRCTGLMLRLMCLVAPGMFKSQTRKFMERFKAFAESAEAG